MFLPSANPRRCNEQGVERLIEKRICDGRSPLAGLYWPLVKTEKQPHPAKKDQGHLDSVVPYSPVSFGPIVIPSLERRIFSPPAPP